MKWQLASGVASAADFELGSVVATISKSDKMKPARRSSE
jgi:hypothetical protein